MSGPLCPFSFRAKGINLWDVWEKTFLRVLQGFLASFRSLRRGSLLLEPKPFISSTSFHVCFHQEPSSWLTTLAPRSGEISYWNCIRTLPPPWRMIFKSSLTFLPTSFTLSFFSFVAGRFLLFLKILIYLSFYFWLHWVIVAALNWCPELGIL